MNAAKLRNEPNRCEPVFWAPNSSDQVFSGSKSVLSPDFIVIYIP